MQMKKYETYKDSGIEWIGEIPATWSMERLRFLGSLYGGLTGKSREDFEVKEGEEYELFIPFTNIFNNNILNPNLMQKVKVGKNETQNKVSKGDILFLMSSEDYDGIGKSSILDTEFPTLYLNSFCKGFKVKKDLISPYFLNYYLLGNSARYQIRKSANGFTRINLKMNGLLDTRICIPTYQEQTTIATYLDHKVACIDKSVEAINAQIDDLKAYRQSVISEAVTKGLNPDAPMKDSGIEWIGEIPEGWECIRLRYLLSTPLLYGASESGDSEHNKYPRYIRITDITEDGKLKEIGAKYLNPILAAPYMLKKGDILFARSGATVGKTYFFNENIDACFAGYLIKATCNGDLIPKYLFYYTQSGVYENWKNSMFTQATIQNIGADKYNELPIVLPSIEEQQSIATYLDTKTAKIDAAIASLEAQKDDLNALKQSVISEAVTGKIDVREWYQGNAQ